MSAYYAPAFSVNPYDLYYRHGHESLLGDEHLSTQRCSGPAYYEAALLREAAFGKRMGRLARQQREAALRQLMLVEALRKERDRAIIADAVSRRQRQLALRYPQDQAAILLQTMNFPEGTRVPGTHANGQTELNGLYDYYPFENVQSMPKPSFEEHLLDRLGLPGSRDNALPQHLVRGIGRESCASAHEFQAIASRLEGQQAARLRNRPARDVSATSEDVMGVLCGCDTDAPLRRDVQGKHSRFECEKFISRIPQQQWGALRNKHVFVRQDTLSALSNGVDDIPIQRDVKGKGKAKEEVKDDADFDGLASSVEAKLCSRLENEPDYEMRNALTDLLALIGGQHSPEEGRARSNKDNKGKERVIDPEAVHFDTKAPTGQPSRDRPDRSASSSSSDFANTSTVPASTSPFSEEAKNAGYKILTLYRAHRLRLASMTAITRIEEELHELESNFVLPAHLDFAVAQSAGDRDLAFTSNNMAVHVYEHALNGLLGKLDAVESGGDGEIRGRRKSVVLEIEKTLEDLIKAVRHRWAAEHAKRRTEDEKASDNVELKTDHSSEARLQTDLTVGESSREAAGLVNNSEQTNVPLNDVPLSTDSDRSNIPTTPVVRSESISPLLERSEGLVGTSSQQISIASLVPEGTQYVQEPKSLTANDETPLEVPVAVVILPTIVNDTMDNGVQTDDVDVQQDIQDSQGSKSSRVISHFSETDDPFTAENLSMDVSTPVHSSPAANIEEDPKAAREEISGLEEVDTFLLPAQTDSPVEARVSDPDLEADELVIVEGEIADGPSLMHEDVSGSEWSEVEG